MSEKSKVQKIADTGISGRPYCNQTFVYECGTVRFPSDRD